MEVRTGRRRSHWRARGDDVAWHEGCPYGEGGDEGGDVEYEFMGGLGLGDLAVQAGLEEHVVEVERGGWGVSFKSGCGGQRCDVRQG